MTENEFYTDDFEQLLKEKAEQFSNLEIICEYTSEAQHRLFPKKNNPLVKEG